MTRNEILSRLCVYDERNPDYLPFDEDDLSRKPIDCACDNCYYGRKKMAEFILSQLPQQEISDEEIEKAFTIETEVQTTKYVGEIAGAKWYREQLKCKGNERA